MASPFAALALEFDVLVRRAARTGQVALEALTDTYIALHPDAPEHAQRLDLPRFCAALTALPDNFCDTPQLLLVPDIAGYTHTPLASDTFICGRMPDGTLLGDLSDGHADVVRWLGCLCEINRARRQALRLLEAQPVAPSDALGHLAFAWGLDEASLQEAIATCGPALLQTLHPETPLPHVAIHALAAGAARARSHARDAARVLGAVAEMGLAERPMHLWLGEGRIADCLSPYSRELRDVLWHWGQTHPERIGTDIPAQPGDDAIYAVCHDFLAHDPRLTGEKDEAERTVGIYRHAVQGLEVEMVDLGRVDPTVCDPRLPQFRLRAPAPVVVRVNARDPDLLHATLEAFINTLGNRLVSVTIALPGQAPAAMAGEITLPRFAIAWAGGHKIPLLNDAWSPRDFMGLADRPVQSGDTLLVPALGPQTPGALELMADDPAIACVQLGTTDIAATLHEAIWSGKVNERIECAWVAVPLVGTPQGRPTLPCLRSLTAVAIARLRRIVTPPSIPSPGPMPGPSMPRPAAASEQEPQRKPAWSMRIKA